MTQVEKTGSGKNSPFWRGAWLLTISIEASCEGGAPCGLPVASFVERHDSGMSIFVKSQMRKICCHKTDFNALFLRSELAFPCVCLCASNTSLEIKGGPLLSHSDALSCGRGELALLASVGWAADFELICSGVCLVWVLCGPSGN